MSQFSSETQTVLKLLVCLYKTEDTAFQTVSFNQCEAASHTHGSTVSGLMGAPARPPGRVAMPRRGPNDREAAAPGGSGVYVFIFK